MLLVDDRIKALARQYQGRSSAEVALLAKRFPDLPMARVAQQIKGREKARSKLPSWAANQDIAYPASLAMEQCTSEVAARYKAGLVPRGRLGADLTGGFGVDARFLAERFDRFHYFERDGGLVQSAMWNFAVFGMAGHVDCHVCDAEEALSRLPPAVDFLYLDPARRDARGLKVSGIEECEPNLVPLWPRLLQQAKCVMAKLSPGLDLSAALDALGQVEAAYVVSVENECKELLLLARRGATEAPCIHCVNLDASGRAETFSFTLAEESKLPSAYAPPGQYLYEPNASVMKAGGFKSLGRQFGLGALGPRTRLYASDALLPGFPGRVFRVDGSGALAAKDARRLFPDRRANVVSRNSGLKADALREKLGLRDGGEAFAIGASLADGSRRLFACRLLDANASVTD